MSISPVLARCDGLIEPGLDFEFRLLSAGSAGAKSVRSFIAEGYRKAYGAHVTDFLPHLLAMYWQGQPVAALGLRFGSERPFYLESYLERPLEQALAASLGRPIDRDSIVEIGNLHASRKGASLPLFICMTAILARVTQQWMVFTATPQVEKLITKLKYSPLSLGVADPDKLGASAAQWGSYYQSRPTVMAGDVAAAMAGGRRHPQIVKVLQQYQVCAAALAAGLTAEGGLYV